MTHMSNCRITATPNGPYIVEGKCDLIDSEGMKLDTASRKRFALCRCGASVSKPFCDGTHTRIGFKAAQEAVLDEERAANPAGD